jgi:hypothetical protein
MVPIEDYIENPPKNTLLLIISIDMMPTLYCYKEYVIAVKTS